VVVDAQHPPPWWAFFDLILNNIIKRVPIPSIMDVIPAFHIDFEPRNANGSRYNLHIVKDVHGGWLVVWGTICTWRYYPPRYCHSSEGEMKVMTGNYNAVDTLAVREYLDGVGFLA